MSNLEELQQDLAELKSFNEQATRSNTKTILAREITKLERVV